MEARRVIEGKLSSIGIHGLSNKGIKAPIRLSPALGASSGGYFLLYTLYFTHRMPTPHHVTLQAIPR